ncbi:transglutaminase family protein [Rhizobium ruizarguesonis]|jgi:transglutaminase-like putative cysteine protease|uniref:Transglutaminase family protein n=1 Tax=Rhizobium ruizarguesonis TaxID=2081791 RepID=A0AAE8Q780_9HYPH|nr:transglutaminase family protein [Rhizobium ruizarguesonis]QIO49353.1 transglutaminase family protein [Rhizobium leguminosarum bv. trifolii]QJS32458.1 transglutaminase family protein [Rhizobium leguminosarum bv. trifolii TA1]TAT70273.1 transglutaminase family protein [Rhizobium ruizarguesonis]TAT71270.1 transglutaminase family protein [Rhizobium ruizarguesonis]TAT73010.1 transglutaminase family protein [Rhizobium ruizarguesonis]
MTKLSIHHRTTYRYREDVALLPHILMMRPRESRELRLLSHELTINPAAQISWSNDVFGNAIVSATFQSRSAGLEVDSFATVDLTAAAWPVFDIAASAINYPFRYADRDWTDLGALAAQQYPDDAQQLRNWAKAFIAGNPTDTLSLLKDISLGIASTISYESREEEGTQVPLATLARKRGSCRDFAVLFAEAVRSLGFGARIVSGYLFNPNRLLAGSTDNGSTHAWTEVFIPGAGWITFDPTNRSMGGANLIPVAVTRDIAHAVPVSGSYTGTADAFLSMDVAVDVTQIEVPL